MSHPPASTGSFLREPRHVVAALRLLIFAALALLGAAQGVRMPWLYAAIASVYGLTIVGYLLAARDEFDLPRVRVAIFLFDVAMVSSLIVMRGEDVQPLFMGYFLVVLLAALLAGIGSAFTNALLATGLYVVLAGWGRPPAELLDLDLIGPSFFFFVIAVFMGHVATDARARADEARNASTLSRALQLSTARLRAARDGQQAGERLHTLEVLCAGIAHELRRPVAALRECTQEGRATLDAARDGDAEAQGELEAILADLEHESRRIGQVVTALGELGRGGGARHARVTAAETLAGAERLAGPACAAAGIRLDVCAATDREIAGDPTRLAHALAILIDNARDAVAGTPGAVVRVHARDDGESGVAFEVHDDGAGIPPEVCERMFDPFYTTKGPGQGTGLGLYVAREIAAASRGALACETGRGEGTTFVLALPGAPADAAADAA